MAAGYVKSTRRKMGQRVCNSCHAVDNSAVMRVLGQSIRPMAEALSYRILGGEELRLQLLSTGEKTIVPVRGRKLVMSRGAVSISLLMISMLVVGCRSKQTEQHNQANTWYVDFHSTQIPMRASPDGQMLLFLDQRNSAAQILRVVDVNTRLTKYHLTLNKSCLRFSWNPDGNRIIFSCFGGKMRNMYLWNMKAGRLDSVPIPPTVGISTMTWSPDGRYMLYKASNRTLGTRNYYVLIDSINLTSHIMPMSDTASWPSWAPDSKHIALLDSAHPTTIYTVNLSGIVIHRKEIGKDIKLVEAIWSSSSDNILFTYRREKNDSTEIGIYNADNGRTRMLDLKLQDPKALAWSPDGQFLYYGRDIAETRPLYQANLTTKSIHTIVDTGYNLIVSQSSNGASLIISNDGNYPQTWYRYNTLEQHLDLLFKPQLSAIPVTPGHTVWIRSIDQYAIPLIEHLSPHPLASPAVIVEVHSDAKGGRAFIKWAAFSQIALREGVHYIEVNYRGSGGYGKAFQDAGSSDNQIKDALAAVEYAHNMLHIPYQRIMLYGVSDGAAIALEAARRAPGHMGYLVMAGLIGANSSALPYAADIAPSHVMLIHSKYDSISLSGAIEIVQKTFSIDALRKCDYREYEFEDEHTYVVPTTQPAYEKAMVQMLEGKGR